MLITNKGSNILEDLDTLRLLSKTVPEYVHPVDEEGVSAGAFELIFAFDEVISMGHRESITVAQVRYSSCKEVDASSLHKAFMPLSLASLSCNQAELLCVDKSSADLIDSVAHTITAIIAQVCLARRTRRSYGDEGHDFEGASRGYGVGLTWSSPCRSSRTQTWRAMRRNCTK